MRSRRRRGGGLEDEEAMDRVGRTLEHPRTGQAITKLGKWLRTHSFVLHEGKKMSGDVPGGQGTEPTHATVIAL